MWHNAFPDEHTTFEDQVAEATKWSAAWPPRPPTPGRTEGMPPTGKQITVSGIWIDRIVDGRIVERWGVLDMMGAMQQLGLIPAPAGAPA